MEKRLNKTIRVKIAHFLATFGDFSFSKNLTGYTTLTLSPGMVRDHFVGLILDFQEYNPGCQRGSQILPPWFR